MSTAPKDVDHCGAGPARYRHHVEVLANRFRYPNRSLLFGRARLFGDRIELSGWGLHGRHRQCIPLGLISTLDYHPLEDDANLTLYLATGDAVPLHIDEAHRWRETFEHWFEYAVLPSAKLLDDRQAADLAG